MEARQALTGNFAQKGTQIALATFAALALAGIGAVIVRDLAGTQTSAQPVVYPAPGTVLRQDNPVQGSTPVVYPAPGTVLRQDNPVQGSTSVVTPAGTHTERNSGSQIVGDSGPIADGTGSQSDLTRVLPK